MRPIERKFHRTAPHLNASNRPRRRDLVTRTRVHHKEGNLMPAGKCLKLTAGFRHAVHFMVDAGEKRDAWTILLHEITSDVRRVPQMIPPPSQPLPSGSLQSKSQLAFRKRPSA